MQTALNGKQDALTIQTFNITYTPSSSSTVYDLASFTLNSGKWLVNVLAHCDTTALLSDALVVKNTTINSTNWADDANTVIGSRVTCKQSAWNRQISGIVDLSSSTTLHVGTYYSPGSNYTNKTVTFNIVAVKL